MLYSTHRLILPVAIGSLMTGLSILPQVAIAQPRVINPCPGIYYEEPFNSTRRVPDGCPPNAATVDDGSSSPSVAPGTRYPATPDPNAVTTPPLPETAIDPIATVSPVNGSVAVQLQNITNTSIEFQALGYTEPRTLVAGETITLRDLPTPVTFTIRRPDSGFLQVQPATSSETGLLVLNLDETADLGQNQRSIVIQADGQVLAY